MVEALSVLPIFLVIVCIEAYEKAAARGKILDQSKTARPGCIINTTPPRPIMMAAQRRSPICSPKIGMDRRVINKGATKKMAIASAYGMAATAMNSVKFAKINKPALNKCQLRCLVLRTRNPPSHLMIKKIMSIAITLLISII